jgi:hypothetical protein
LQTADPPRHDFARRAAIKDIRAMPKSFAKMAFIGFVILGAIGAAAPDRQ